MTIAALIDRAIKAELNNLFYAINHVTVPEPMCVIMDDPETKVNAFLAPACKRYYGFQNMQTDKRKMVYADSGG